MKWHFSRNMLTLQIPELQPFQGYVHNAIIGATNAGFEVTLVLPAEMSFDGATKEEAWAKALAWFTEEFLPLTPDGSAFAEAEL